MLQLRRSRPGIFAFLCHLFTAYALVITLCAPFSLRRVEARPVVKNAATAAAATTATAVVANPVAVKKAKYRDGELIVRFRQGVSDDYKNLLATSKGGRRKGKLRGRSRLERLELPAAFDIEQLADALRLLPEVELAEPNYLVERADTTPNDARLSEQWALHNTGAAAGSVAGSDIGALAAWDRTTGAASTVVAVVDSGIDFTHPDLQANRWTNAGERNTQGGNNTDDDGNGYTDDRDGWDWVGNDNNPRDEQGHGTMVAGIIAAEGNNATGISGVMWRAGLMNLRVLDNTGTGDVADAVEAIDYAVANGARVINCSWGTDGESVALREAVERAAQSNVVVVASAGNGSRDTDVAAHYPASYRVSNVIGVAASDAADNLAAFSNWGATSVSIAAPGKDILTTRMGGGYTLMDGTSAAAPVVAGIAGLIKSERWWLSGGGTRAAIVDGARAAGGLTGKVAAGGVASAAGALAALQGPDTPPPGSGGNGGSGGNVTPPPPSGGGGGSTSPTASPSPQAGLSGAGLPNLDEARRARPGAPQAPVSIKADRALLCHEYPDPPPGCEDFNDPPPGSGDPRSSNARTEPQNQTGQSGVDLGSRNFNWSANLVGLPGRAGMNLDVTLFYNSLVWTRQGTGITFNADKGFPAPGFSLGLPKIQPQYLNTTTGTPAYLLVTPSGGRVALPRVGDSNIYEAIDGSLMQLVDGAPKVVRTSDGTQYIFGRATSDDGALCTEIKDRNGNVVSVGYDGLGRVSTMTDTLGRVINFNYDTNGNLATIKQQRGGGEYTWATFGYGDRYMKVNFPGLSVYGPHNTQQNVLLQVSFADGTRYDFGYNTWGQVTRITRFGADGTQLASTEYDLPADDSQAQSDCPRFTKRLDWVAWGIRGADGVFETRYSSFAASPTSPVERTEVTQVGDAAKPEDDVTYKEFFATAGWQKGLTTATETWAGGVKRKWTTTLWTQDDEALTYQKNPRVAEMNIYDADNNHRRTTIGYTPDFYRLPQDVREWGGKTTDAAPTLFRRTHTTYNLNPAYTSRRIIGLAETVRVYNGEGDTQTESGLVAKSVNSYDWGGGHLAPAGATTQHDAAYTEGFAEGRGNLVAVESYDVSAPNDPNRRTAQYIGYDTNGSVVFTAARHYAHRTNISYDDDFEVASDNGTRRAYPTRVIDPDGFTSKTQYDYHTGNLTRAEDPKGAVMTTTYDAKGRVEKVTNETNGAYTKYVYAPQSYYVNSFTTASAAGQELHTIEVFDGAGRLSAAATEMPGSAGHSAVRYEYDEMGRRVAASNPTEVAPGWNPAGDDQAAGWQWTRQVYDWQGRPTVTINQDNSTTEAIYGGCGCAGGEQVTIRDESGRRKRMTKDVLGRLVKTEELHWNGDDVYSAADYTYNARDQLTRITRAGETGRTLEYDGHGRLSRRVTPEQGETTYTYLDDNAVQFVTDARGARTEYRYNNNRGLPTYIEFTAPAGSGVAGRTNIAFDYDAAGNRKWMAELGFGRVDYEYDTLSRLKSETRTFDGITDAFKLEYGYDLGGRLTSVKNPWGISVGYARDRAGRVEAVTNGGYPGFGNYTNDIRYRASGAVKSKVLGNGLNFTAQYDKRLRLKSWSVPLPQGGGMGSEYDYSNFGENTGRVTYARNLYDGALDRSYRYDHVGRLMHSLTGQEARQHALGESRERIDGDYGQAYHYDTRGNLTFRDGWGGAGQLAAVTYDAKNQRPGQVHDAAGNMTSDGYTSFAYDATGREASASSGVTHTYDGDLTRIKRVENGQTTLYLRSSVLGGAVMAEMNAQGNWTRGYVYGESGGLTAIQQPEGYVEWVTQDPVTKGQRITNAAGTVTAALEFDPFGGETSKSSNSYRQPQKYTTYTRDSNQTDDAMHRRYIAYWSRFQQPDPYDGSYNLAEPQSLNRYSYVQNDPVNLVDPSGLNASSGMWTPGVGGYGCDASYGSCGGGWDGTGGGGGGGFGFSGGLFDSERFNPGSAGEAAYAGRLRNTYEALALNRSLQQAIANGNSQAIAGILAAVQASSHLALVFQPNINLPANATPLQTVRAYLDGFGVTQFIDLTTLRTSGNGFAFQWKDPQQAQAFLNDNPLFRSGIFGFYHINDAGFPFTDYRSLTSSGTPRSLQVVSGTRGAYADTDRFNPYQDVVSFFRHGFQELIGPRIGRLFRR